MADYKDVSYINCRRKRKENGLRLRELSQRSGPSAVCLSNYENGKVNITIASLYASAKALDTSVNRLISPDEEDLVPMPRDRRFARPETSENPALSFRNF